MPCYILNALISVRRLYDSTAVLTLSSRPVFELVIGVAVVCASCGVTGASELPAPRFLMATPHDSQITVEWEAVQGATGYNVKRRARSTGALEVIAENVTVTAHTDLELRNRQTYQYVVSALDHEGESLDTFAVSAKPTTPVLEILPAGAEVEKLATRMQFTEGPVWTPADGGFLIFSDINGNRLYRWAIGDGLSVFRERSNNANGNTLDLNGRLLTCEHSARRVSITLDDGTVETLVDKIDGNRFNSPNDVAVRSDGTIWFTDPTYGLSGRKEQDGNYVFRFDPISQTATRVAEGFTQPNGLCFSPDESRLYVADSGGPFHIRVFEVQADGSLTGGEVFATISPGAPDGIRSDPEGRIWSSAGDGVHIFSPEGELLQKILVPETPANLSFGGPNDDMLFITARTSLYGITHTPDLIVAEIGRFTTTPVQGDAVTFGAVVKNQGTGPTSAGQRIRVGFNLDDGETIVWSDSFEKSLPPGGSVVLTSDGGVSGPTWTAVSGSYRLNAVVDDLNGILESVEDNNSRRGSVSVNLEPPDSDGDGLDDRAEAMAGTDPSDIDSVLEIISIDRSNEGKNTIMWSSVAGKVYRISVAESLSGGSWQSVDQDVTATDVTLSWTDADSSGTSQRYYRVEWQR